jgi:DNA polymerase-3 subunit delta'
VNDWVEEMSQLGRERLKSFFEYSIRMIRENLVSNLKKPELVYLTEKESAFSEKFHPYINGKNVIQLYEEFSKAFADIERNGYARIVLFDLTLQIIKLIRK